MIWYVGPSESSDSLKGKVTVIKFNLAFNISNTLVLPPEDVLLSLSHLVKWFRKPTSFGSFWISSGNIPQSNYSTPLILNPIRYTDVLLYLGHLFSITKFNSKLFVPETSSTSISSIHMLFINSIAATIW